MTKGGSETAEFRAFIMCASLGRRLIMGSFVPGLLVGHFTLAWDQWWEYSRQARLVVVWAGCLGPHQAATLAGLSTVY